MANFSPDRNPFVAIKLPRTKPRKNPLIRKCALAGCEHPRRFDSIYCSTHFGQNHLKRCHDDVPCVD